MLSPRPTPRMNAAMVAPHPAPRGWITALGTKAPRSVTLSRLRDSRSAPEITLMAIGVVCRFSVHNVAPPAGRENPARRDGTILKFRKAPKSAAKQKATATASEGRDHHEKAHFAVPDPARMRVFRAGGSGLRPRMPARHDHRVPLFTVEARSEQASAQRQSANHRGRRRETDREDRPHEDGDPAARLSARLSRCARR